MAGHDEIKLNAHHDAAAFSGRSAAVIVNPS
jgi:hypothetical protein